MNPNNDRTPTERTIPDGYDQTTSGPGTGPPTGRRVTVPDAAEALGISVEAVRARIKRGTLRKEKDHDGTVYVWLEANRIIDRARPDQNQSNDRFRPDGDRTDLSNEQARGQSVDQTQPDALAVALRDQVEILRGELEDRKEEARRKDAIIMSLSQRVPELPPTPSQETPGSPETGAEGSGGGDAPPVTPEPTRRSWLVRFFFGP